MEGRGQPTVCMDVYGNVKGAVHRSFWGLWERFRVDGTKLRWGCRISALNFNGGDTTARQVTSGETKRQATHNENDRTLKCGEKSFH